MTPDEVEFDDDEAVWGERRWRAAAFHQSPFLLQVFAGTEHRAMGENAALVDLYGGQHKLGVPIADHNPDGEGQGMVEMFDGVLAGREVVARAVRYVIDDGAGQRDVFADTWFTPLRDTSGSVVGVVAGAVDVTEAVLAERDQEAAAAELSRRYRRATDVIEEVQRALLPTRLPVLPTVDIAAAYVVGGEEQAAGGDWFDVLPRPDGSVAAVVGDVVGHGVAASAVMAQLRAVTLERLHAGADPAAVVRALDRFVEVAPDGRSATVCVVVLRPGGREIVCCSAGHPPPLLVGEDGESRYLELPPVAPVGDGDDRYETSATLGEGELVLLYTDGVLERPGVPVTAATVELARTAGAAVADRLVPALSLPSVVDRVTTQTLERLTRLTGSTDDITLLAVRPIQPRPHLHLEVEASASVVPGLRRDVRRWLGPDAVAALAGEQLDQVLTELCDNVVEHAYADAGTGPLVVDAHLDGLGSLHLAVSDRGRWLPRPEPEPGRGVGLALVQQLCDAVEVDRTEQGTTVTVHLRPWKAPHGARPVAPRAVHEVFDLYTELRDDEAVLTLRGPVHASDVHDLEGELALSAGPGALPLTVDLSAVSMISSAAIRALRRHLERARQVGLEVRVVSAPGTVAHQVLTLVGIDTGVAGR